MNKIFLKIFLLNFLILINSNFAFYFKSFEFKSKLSALKNFNFKNLINFDFKEKIKSNLILKDIGSLALFSIAIYPIYLVNKEKKFDF